MAATKSSDFKFEPKVWSDHAMAYFDERLVYGAFAITNEELEREGTGLTVNFPYYETVGEAEEPSEDESLKVDNLMDDSFNATVLEVGKAVGVKKKAFKASADKQANIMAEAQRQIGRRHAEKADAKLNDETTTYNGRFGGPIGADPTKYNNMTIGYVGEDATAENRTTIRTIAIAKSR